MNKAKESKSFLKYIVTLWFLVLLGWFLIFSFFWSISKGVAGEMPSFEQIENPDSYLATEVFSSDSVSLGKYYRENRSFAKFKELPDNLVYALMATEDERFHNHVGIDFKALLRAIIFLGKRGGGSTITQQLAKNLFKTREREIKELEEGGEYTYEKTFLEKIAKGKLLTVLDKAKEFVIAVKLEKQYTKEEILTMYLNTVEFSDNAFGIKSAAVTYFNKPIQNLNTEESAVLVGMLQAPTRFNPRRNPENSTNRRNIVLYQMYNYKYIAIEVKDSLQALPLEIDFQTQSHLDGLAPYFRESLRLWLRSWASNKTKPDGTPYNIYKDGLKIYTTIDSRMQQYAENAVNEHLKEMQDIFFKHWGLRKEDPWEYFDKYHKEPNGKSENLRIKENLVKTILSNDTSMTKEKAYEYIEKPKEMTVWSYKGDIDTTMSPIDSVKYYRMFLQTGFLAVDPKTGHIKAWVGGSDFEHFKYDHVNINTKRQIGSTFKPFIYTLALKEKGYSPCFEIPNEKVTFEKDDPKWELLQDWTPVNSDNKYGGMMSLKHGLANSVNTITAFLMHELTPKAVIDLVRQMGVTSKIDPVPSICLGVADLSVIEMVGAYTTYANKGIYTEPVFLSRIEDKHGNIIEEFYPNKVEALDEETAYIMTQILRGTIDGGTGYRLRFKYGIPYTLDVAGKTGTTQSNSDAWFLGYTPELVAGCWVGGSDRFVRFRTIQYGQGASLALPIWAKFANQVYQDSTLNYNIEAKFEKPHKALSVELDCSKFQMNTTNNLNPFE